ncbi:hypothetical protein HNR16_002516 [Pseudoclavibacter chungangensis]|nr:hypothetical protein [Pseudoclavibacter chungangensis]NYJ67728.1 hypothetical protein [Pseudoclavibacter chungangensis]
MGGAAARRVAQAAGVVALDRGGTRHGTDAHRHVDAGSTATAG